MDYTDDLEVNTPNNHISQTLLLTVIVAVAFVLIGLALALGLGIGLNNYGTLVTIPFTTTTSTTILTTTTTQLTISTYSSSLTTSSPLYARLNQSASNYYYQSIYMLVSTTGNYNISSNSTTDLFGSLYNTSFSPANPSVNLITFNDDGGSILLNFQLTATLNIGVVYVLVVTTSFANRTGSFTIIASGIGDAIFIPLDVTVTTTIATTTSIITTATTTPVTTTIAPMFSSTVTSALVTTDLLYARPNTTTTSYYCDSLQVIVNVTGNYTFQSNSTLDLMGFFYNNSFSAANPSANLIANDDDSGTIGSNQFQFSIVLNSNVTYVLVVTTFSPTITGSYAVIVVGPGAAAFTLAAPLATSLFYGTVANGGADDTSNGRVNINVNDDVSFANGVSTNSYVQQVSFNFSVAPSGTPNIWLYVMNGTIATATFVPISVYQLPSTSISANTGVQTFVLPPNALPVISGQYVAVGLGVGGGSLYAVSGGIQYYLTTTNFAKLTTATYTNLSQGFAFQFTVITISLVSG